MKNLARIVAGTYVEDLGEALAKGPVALWVLRECRQGSLRPAVEAFCAAQPEFLHADDVCVESVDDSCAKLVVQCRQMDHESPRAFIAEVRFVLDPVTGKTERI